MRDLTKGNIYKTFILFAIPMVLSGILSQAYSMVDTVIAGKYLGENGLAATGATNAVITVIESIFWGYCAGFSIYIAKLFGAGEYRKIKNGIYMNYIVIISSTLFMAATLIFFHREVFDFLNVPKNIENDAFIYYSIYLGGLFAIILNYNGVMIMNAFGVSVYPFIMSIVSAVVNITGNIITVTVFNMGVTGLGLSTVGSAVVVAICYAVKYRKCFREMGVDKEKISLSSDIMKESVGYAIPTTAQQMIMYLAGVIVSPVVNGLGSAAMASFTVANRLYDFNAKVYQNSSKTLSNFAAQGMGTKNYGKIRKGVKVGFLQGVMFELPVILVCSVGAASVCAMFFPSGFRGDALTYTVMYARFFLPFVFFNLINNLFHAFFRGVKAMRHLVASTLVGAVSKVIASLILARYYGIYGIYGGWVASWICESAAVIYMYRSGKWRSREMAEYENSIANQ